MTATETTPDGDNTKLQERREAIGLFATDGLAGLIDGGEGADPAEALNFALQMICRELIHLGITLEQEVQPATKVLGQWVGGVIGTGTTCDEEIARTMYERGSELRAHIIGTIGWPHHTPIAELRERWADEAVAP